MFIVRYSLRYITVQYSLRSKMLRLSRQLRIFNTPSFSAVPSKVTGVVLEYNQGEGYGFVAPDSCLNKRIYCRASDVVNVGRKVDESNENGRPYLRRGDTVRFEMRFDGVRKQSHATLIEVTGTNSGLDKGHRRTRVEKIGRVDATDDWDGDRGHGRKKKGSRRQLAE